MADRARWLLLTHEGRLALATIYCILSVLSIITYTIQRSVAYGAGQFLLTAFGLLWTRWCLQRGATATD
jgi:hypothetical protein